MKVVVRHGVRVVGNDALRTVRDFPFKDFKVLDSGAVELSGPQRLTLAPGIWSSVSFIVAEEEPEGDADADGGSI